MSKFGSRYAKTKQNMTNCVNSPRNYHFPFKKLHNLVTCMPKNIKFDKFPAWYIFNVYILKSKIHRQLRTLINLCRENTKLDSKKIQICPFFCSINRKCDRFLHEFTFQKYQIWPFAYFYKKKNNFLSNLTNFPGERWKDTRQQENRNVHFLITTTCVHFPFQRSKNAKELPNSIIYVTEVQNCTKFDFIHTKTNKYLNISIRTPIKTNFCTIMLNFVSLKNVKNK